LHFTALVLFANTTKGLSIKTSAVREEGIFRGGHPHFLGAKNFRFFEIYGVFARTRRGWASVDILTTGGQFFAILCGPLFWTAPNRLAISYLVYVQRCNGIEEDLSLQ